MQDNGAAQCLGAFYAAHKQELFTYALSITRSPACAEDAVHDAFSRVLAKGRLPLEVRPYIFRCVRNASLDVLRSAERERRKVEGCRSIFQEGCGAALQETVTELLMLLSNKEREIVVLKVYSGLTLKEIAKVYGTRQGTVAATYWRSLQKLRKRVHVAAGGDSPLREQLP
jgi:RNA polymerase sigma factor (sigma-70 family)